MPKSPPPLPSYDDMQKYRAINKDDEFKVLDALQSKKKTIKKNIAETHTDLKEDKRTHKKSVETSVDYDKDLSPKILRAINKSINEAVRIALHQHLSGKGMKEECYYSSSDEEPPKPKAKPRGRPKNIKLT